MKVLTSTVFDDIDPFADSDEDEERIINPTCRCESAILLGYKFHHFGQSPNRILSSFDDFGYNVYVDSSGVEHRFFAHHYQGIVMSGTHDISEVDKVACVL